MNNNHQLVIGLTSSGYDGVKVLHVERDQIPSLIEDLLAVHSKIVAKNPRLSDDPSVPYHMLLRDVVAANDGADPCDHVLGACLYFLSLSNNPRDLEGPTIVHVTEDGVYCKHVDMGEMLERAGTALH